MPFKSRRFWMLIVGGVLGVVSIVVVALHPESEGAIERVLPLVVGLLAVGVHSEGSRPMGDR
tara:strand:+ start:8408 stop:8593 length:186 start_codon:yes stop_codon:yes gene_type:complete